jgi:hypothetical protein
MVSLPWPATKLSRPKLPPAAEWLISRPAPADARPAVYRQRPAEDRLHRGGAGHGDRVVAGAGVDGRWPGGRSDRDRVVAVAHRQEDAVAVAPSGRRVGDVETGPAHDPVVGHHDVLARSGAEGAHRQPVRARAAVDRDHPGPRDEHVIAGAADQLGGHAAGQAVDDDQVAGGVGPEGVVAGQRDAGQRGVRGEGVERDRLRAGPAPQRQLAEAAEDGVGEPAVAADPGAGGEAGAGDAQRRGPYQGGVGQE